MSTPPRLRPILNQHNVLSSARVPFPPLPGELGEPVFGGGGRRGVDVLQPAGDLPPVRLGGIPKAVAHQVDDTDSRCQPW